MSVRVYMPLVEAAEDEVNLSSLSLILQPEHLSATALLRLRIWQSPAPRMSGT